MGFLADTFYINGRGFGMTKPSGFVPVAIFSGGGVDARFSAPVSGGGVDVRFSAPVSGGGVDALFSAPVGGGGADAPFSAPVGGGGVDARFLAPVGGGGVDARFLAPVGGGGVAGLVVRRGAESAVSKMKSLASSSVGGTPCPTQSAALLASAAPARRSTATRRRSHATIARYILPIASGSSVHIPSASFCTNVARDFLLLLLLLIFFLERAIVPPIKKSALP